MLCFVLVLGACADDDDPVPGVVVPVAPPITNEGSLITPVDLGLAPFSYNGMAADASGSWYKFSGGPGSNLILLTNQNPAGAGGLNVYASDNFVSLLCVSVTVIIDPQCAVSCVSGTCVGGIRILTLASGGMTYTLQMN